MMFRPSTEVRISAAAGVAQDAARRHLHGIAERLQPNERLLWQGSPQWRTLAVEALHVRKVALYFAALALWHLIDAFGSSESASAALSHLAWLALAALLACGLLALLGWLAARTTLYVITDRRVVMRCGIALPITINLPFTNIESVALRLRRDGIGDIALTLQTSSRVAYLHLWPHARAWRLSRPQPMLRALPNAHAVARSLAEELVVHTGGSVHAISAPERSANDPSSSVPGHAAPAV